MKYVILCIFILGSTIQMPLSAQEVLYSSYQNFDSRTGDFSVVGKTGGKLYTYRSGSSGYFLDAWDDSMNKEATIVLDFFPSHIYETRFISYPDKIIVLYQAIEHGWVVQYVAKLDATARLQGDPLALDSIKTGFFGATRDYFASAVSDNKTKIAIYAPFTKGDEFSLRGVLFNNDISVLHRFKTTYSGDNSLSYGESVLGNDGSFYLPLFARVGGKDYADGVWMLTMPGDGGPRSVSELRLGERYAANTFMRLDASGQKIDIAGFYSQKKSGSYDGILISSYDVAAKTFSPLRAIPIDNALLDASGERSKKKAFNDYQIRQLIIRNDGGFVLIAEEYFMTTRSGYSPYGYYSMAYSPFMSNTNIREYHYNDIMALSYDRDGNRQWQAFIRKNQYSQEDGGRFSSYTLLNTGGSLGFLFNDFGTRVSSIQLATVDGEGKTNVRSLAAGTPQDPDWLPRSGKQVSGHEIVVPCIRRRDLCFAKIVF